MKKLTKLFSTVAFVSALALVGCANPNGPSTDNNSKPETNVPDIDNPVPAKPTEIAKPEGYTPSKNANSVTSLEDAETKEFLYSLGQEFYLLPMVSKDILYNCVSKDPLNSDLSKKIEEHNTTVNNYMKNIQAQTKNLDSSVEGNYQPKTYNLSKTDTLELKKYYLKQSNFYDITSDEQSETVNQDINYFVDIKDTSKLDLSSGNIKSRETMPEKLNFIKAIKFSDIVKYNYSENTNKDGHVTYKDYLESENMIGTMLFDNGTYNGYCSIEFKESYTGNLEKEGAEEISAENRNMFVTFYDLKGNETLKRTEVDVNQFMQASEM